MDYNFNLEAKNRDYGYTMQSLTSGIQFSI